MDTVWILGDQLGRDHAGLEGRAKKTTRILLIESVKRATRLKYHQQKLVLIFAAMRQRAAEFEEDGWTVDYRAQQDSFETALAEHVSEHKPSKLVVMEPNDFEVLRALPSLADSIGVELKVLPNNQFLVDREEFSKWAGSKKSLLMETHYRRMRKKLGLLLDEDGEPEGGAWNFDADNRQPYRDFRKEQPAVPSLPKPERDDIVREVIGWVESEFADHPGRAAYFWLPVTRGGAREWLDHFVHHSLAGFGPWEDTMVAGERTLYHSVLSPLLNIGLLTPGECVDAAVDAYKRGQAPLNSVEGFVRQIIGWREFVNGIYWHRGPDYPTMNELGATRELPEWIYTGKTEMACVSECLDQVIATGYNHHIQRLMVLGNFFLLGGYRPAAVLRWFSEMYIDAYDWVMAANVIGMVLHADGGTMATKPYAAGAGYINKMSNYCKGCRYKPSIKTGEEACPFNYLYWNFYDQHAERFRSNHRVGMMLKTLEKKSVSERKAIRKSAANFLDANSG